MATPPPKGKTLGERLFYYGFAALIGVDLGLFMGGEWDFTSRGSAGLAFCLATASLLIAARDKDDFGDFVGWCIEWLL